MNRSYPGNPRSRRDEPEEGEVDDTPSRAGPSRQSLPRKPGSQVTAKWSNPFDSMGSSQPESSNIKPKDSWSPEKAGALPLPLPEKPITASGSNRGKSPVFGREREGDKYESEMGWMPGAGQRRRSGEGGEGHRREMEREGRRYEDSSYRGESRRDYRGGEAYRPQYDNRDRTPPRKSNHSADYGPPRRASPPRASHHRRSDPSPPHRSSRYDDSRDNPRANGTDRREGQASTARDVSRQDRYANQYDGGYKGDGKYRDGRPEGFYEERDNYPKGGYSDRNGSNYSGHRNGSTDRYPSSHPPKNGRTPRKRSPTPPTPPTLPEPEEGEVSSPEATPARPSSPPPDDEMFGPSQNSMPYKPRKILKRPTGSYTKTDTVAHDSPRYPFADGLAPPPPPVDQPPTPPPPIDTPPPPAITPPPTPPMLDRGPNPYLANHGKTVTKVQPQIDFSKAPTGPKIDPSTGGQAPNRDLVQPTTKPVTPAPAKPARKQEKFTMWTEGQEKEKLGRIFHGITTLNDYDLGTKLGEGTFGVVTKGVEKGSGAVVALKKLITHNPRDGVSVTTTREIKILKALHHENVVPIRAMVVHRKSPTDKTERGEVFMVFPYMDHDLCGLLANSNFNPTFTLAKLLLKQLLEGLAYIHAQNIIHRDIKTANILVDQAGRIMIADFGLARTWTPRETMPPHEENEYTNMVVTRWYRAPELLLGSTKYGPEIDLWSAGCVFGEMFSRNPILCGESDRDQLYKIITRCGPLEENFSGWSELPGFPDAPGHPWDQTPLEKSIVDQSAEWGCSAELLGQLLRLDPAKRVTAAEALEHTWFWVPPLPAKPKDGLIAVESSHEFTTRKPEKPAPAPAPRHQPAYNRQGPPQNYPSRSHMPHHRHPPPQQQQQQQQQGMGSMPFGVGMQQGMAYNQGSQSMANPYQPIQPQQVYQHQPPGYPAHHAQPQQPYLPPQNSFQPNINPYGPVQLAPSGYPAGMPPPLPSLNQSRSSVNVPAPPFALSGGGGGARVNANSGLPSKPGIHPPPAPFKLQGLGNGAQQTAVGMKRPPAGPAADGPRDKRYRPDNGGLDYN